MSISILVQPVGIANLQRARQAAESLAGALASKATDKLRVTVVDTLPRSPFYLTDSSGNELSSYVKNLDTALSSIKALLPSSLTSAGNFKIAVQEDAVGLAKDSTVSTLKNALASVGTDKFRVSVVDALPRSPFYLTDSSGNELSSYIKNLDVALSSIKALLPSSLTTAGNFKTAIQEDAVGLAKDSTLSKIVNALASVGTDKMRVSVVDALPRSPFYLTDSSGNELSSYIKNLDTALSSIKSLLPSSLTSSGNFKIAVAEDAVGLAKDSTVSALKNALASVGTDKFRVSVVDTLPRSPFYLTDSSGNELSSYVKNLDTALSSVKGSIDSIKGALASVGTDKLRVTVVDALPRSPFTLYDSAGNELSSYVKNLDTALSSIKALLPSSLTSAGNFRVALQEDNIGLTRRLRTAEASSVSINAGATYTFLNVSGSGLLQELLIVASQNTFRVDVTVDGVTVWSKSYSDASNLTDVMPTMAAFQREDGKYIYFLSFIPFKSSIQVNVVNLNSSSSISVDYLYAKYEVV
jgi:hypothetical protein